jgi:hypothetical protein
MNIVGVLKSSMRWMEHEAYTGGNKNSCKILTRKSKGKEPLGRPRLRSDHNIKKDFKELGWDLETRYIWLMLGTIDWLS